ncbi:MAG: M23 family metallopeptidase [Deltaproteobacteria bacterium]|nr:M23 family metallopeptidase [Deltaproteobacteria bacterium]
MLPLGLKAESHLLDGQIKNLEDQSDRFKGLALSGRDKLERAAKNFESFMYGYMFKEMYKSIEKSDVFGESKHQDVFMGLYMDEVTKKAGITKNGIAGQLIKQYEKMLPETNADLENINATTGDITQGVTGAINRLASGAGSEKAIYRIMKDFDHMLGKMEDKFTSGYGMRMHPISGREAFHHGADYGLDMGTDVRLPSDGKVVFAGENGGYGNTVIVDHGYGINSMYAHLSEIKVKEGDEIHKKALVGTVGSTGVSTGPHLHFEVRKDGKTLDPKHLVSK